MFFVHIVTFSFLAFKCVSVGLQSTGEARPLEQLEESRGDLTDLVSTAKQVICYLSTQKDVTESDMTSYSFTALTLEISS